MYVHHKVFLRQLLEGIGQWMESFHADPQSVIQYSAIIAGFVSISVPISLDIVSRYTVDYKDKEIATAFLKDWRYRFQIWINLTIVFLSIILLASDIKNGGWMFFIIVLDLIAFVVFICFLIIVQQYATNFDEYYSKKLKKRSDEIIQGK